MQVVFDTIRNNVTLRIAVLFVVVMAAAWYFGFTPRERSAITLKILVPYVVVPLGTALLVAGATLWISYKPKLSLWVGFWTCVIVETLVVVGAKL